MRSPLTILGLFLTLNFSAEIYAAPNLLLQCLAKEESELFKAHNVGSTYRLNQIFINELASSNDISLKKNYVDEICQAKTFSPSLGLLRLLLMKESDIFDLSLAEVDASMRPFKMGYINEFQKQVPHFFIQYISSLQSEMPIADCLSKAIPDLTAFNDRIKYLEEEISMHDIVKDKKKIDKIFSKLIHINEIKKECTAIAIKRENKLKSKIKLQKKQDTSF